MMTTICYRTIEPTIYNKGTEYEKSNDTFLAYYTCKSIEEATTEVEMLNTAKPSTLFNGQKIDWNEVKEFFVDEQELFNQKKK